MDYLITIPSVLCQGNNCNSDIIALMSVLGRLDGYILFYRIAGCLLVGKPCDY